MLINLHQPIIQFADIHRSKLIDILIVDAKRQRLLVQPGPMALRADVGLRKLLGPLARRGRHIAVLQHLNVLHHPFERHKIIRRSPHQRTLNLQPFARAVQDFVQRPVGQIAHRRLQRCIILLQQCCYLPEYHAVLILPQRDDGPLRNRQTTVGDNLVNINQTHHPQSLALRTRPLRRIERKVMRCRLPV